MWLNSNQEPGLLYMGLGSRFTNNTKQVLTRIRLREFDENG